MACGLQQVYIRFGYYIVCWIADVWIVVDGEWMAFQINWCRWRTACVHGRPPQSVKMCGPQQSNNITYIEPGKRIT